MVGTKSQVLELIDAQEHLSLEVYGLILELVAKDAEITHFKFRIQQLSIGGFGALEEL